MPGSDATASCLLVAPRDLPDPQLDPAASGTETAATAVLAGGCFWCTEAVFQQLEGVLQVTSGYAGGEQSTANYRSVCTGTTGHAEVIRVEFDPQRHSFGQLLKVFFAVAHDPTQRNRQGADRGTQYRSAIFPVDAEQQRVAAAYIEQLNAAGVFRQPIVTTLEPLIAFYPAEDYHQNYAVLNPQQPYVMQAALPKVAKLEKAFKEKLRQSQ
ncbi:MAG: peptide-methionine (S)-S-oxide reductase MsrA [Planctomycetaceae bacterium]